jgi:hypothetical protein
MKKIMIVSAMAALSSFAAAQVFADFEDGTVDEPYMFRAPGFSGSTAGNLNLADGAPDSAVVVNGTNGTLVNQVDFQFVDGGTWLRLTTFNAPELPNPALDLSQWLLFDVRSSDRLSLGIGIRETGGSGPVGSNAGSGGGIEFVGTSTGVGGFQDTVPADQWVTVAIDIPNAPLTGFAGASADGVLDGDWGSLEHIAIENPGTTDQITIEFDNFRQSPVPEPATMLALGAGLAALAARRRRK